MRTSTRDRRWVNVLMALLLPMIILLPDGSSMADSPSFSISNEFEREQEYIPGDWNTIDTITQEYTFDWDEEFSRRLEIDLNFEVQFEDILRSLDVDEKTVEPSLDIAIQSIIWGIDLVAQDTIDYTNEFNTGRKDSIEYGIDLNLSPFKLPAFNAASRRLLDIQENFEDKVVDRFDASVSYELAESLNLSLSWKEESTDDRLFDDRDIESHDWEFDLDFSKTMTPVMKLDFKTNWLGNQEDTLNNAGVVLVTEREHEIEHNLKLSLDTFPNIESELEIGLLNDFVEDGDERTIDFTIDYDQPIVELGTLTETLTITQEEIDLSTEETSDLDIELEVELVGAPDRHLSYSVKYTLTLSDHEDGIDPAANVDTQDDAFDVSLTLNPNEKAIIENSYSWTASREDGVQTGSSKDLMIEGTFEGEMLNVPNLVFTPLLEVSKEESLVTGESEDIINLQLEFLYSFILQPNAFWELSSTYTWEREDDLTRELEFRSDFRIDLVHPSWDIEFEEEATTTVEYDSGDPAYWEHEITLAVGRDLTPRFRFDTEYTYEYDGDDANSDEFEVDLEWRYRSTSLTFSYSRDRIFENPQDTLRVYGVEFSMDF